ncbi:MAG: deoxyribose-phosphate aldolase [Desulfotomaculaceae bacterium]|nr:deoxyribose-phosphate aldolase [Desulfotomaculaceae bacterium]
MLITLKELARFIDHTLLRPEATEKDVVALCDEARKFGFAAVCVNPCYVGLAYRELKQARVSVCSVIGFPLGAAEPAVKAAEAAAAVRAGASEIDVVMNIGFLKSGLSGQVRADLDGVVTAARHEREKVIVKVILETCLLSNDEKVLASQITVAAGADYVKTSTGFGEGGALASDVRLLRNSVGPEFGVKASGGISDLASVLSMLKEGADRIGTSSGVKIIKEFRNQIGI